MIWDRNGLAAGGQPAALPSELLPQLVQQHDRRFDRAGWLYEIKWDGYRCTAIRGKTSKLLSRRGRSLDTLFPGVKQALAALPCEAVLDGEIVALNNEGVSVFNDLQNHAQNADRIVYYVFDLLHLAGVSLLKVPLIERKRLLAELLEEAGHERLRYVDHVEEHGV